MRDYEEYVAHPLTKAVGALEGTHNHLATWSGALVLSCGLLSVILHGIGISQGILTLFAAEDVKHFCQEHLIAHSKTKHQEHSIPLANAGCSTSIIGYHKEHAREADLHDINADEQVVDSTWEQAALAIRISSHYPE